MVISDDYSLQTAKVAGPTPEPDGEGRRANTGA
jgi:hypothetical protein